MARAVKWAIMSTANINRKVIPAAHASSKIELVAVASRDQARAAQYAKTWEIPRAYGSYDALLADPEVEAVYISLPNSLHCEWAIKALEAGKHVLCEKPLSRHASNVEAAFDAADRTGRLLSEAFMYRHNPQTKRAKQLVDEGAIGELRLIRAVFSYPLYDEDNIRAPLRRRAREGLRRGLARSVGDRLGLRRHAPFPGQRGRPIRLRHRHDGARRAGGHRQRGLALPR